MKKILMMLLGCLMSVSVHAQTNVSNMFVQIFSNGELITSGEGTEGVDDYAIVLSYGWLGELRSADTTSGPSASRHRYGPLRIVKPIARSSVLLRQALDQNQRIDLELRLFATDGQTGEYGEVYRIDLTNGRVAGIRPFSEGATGQYLEEVQFAWQTIEFTDVQTGTSHLVQFPSAL